MMSSLLLGTVLSICTCWLPNMVTLPSQLVTTNFGTWSHQRSFSNFTPLSLHMLKRSWAHTLSRLFMYCSSANNGDADMSCSTVSSNWWQCLHLLFTVVAVVVIDWITLLSIYLLGKLHLSQILGGIRLSQANEIHPSCKVQERVLGICILYNTFLIPLLSAPFFRCFWLNLYSLDILGSCRWPLLPLRWLRVIQRCC